MFSSTLQIYVKKTVFTFLLCLFLSSALIHTVKDILPIAPPLCIGNGSMFGYAMSMVKSDKWIWLVVGRPWDCAVNIYRTSVTEVPLQNTTSTMKVTSCQGDTSSSTVPLTATRPPTAVSCTETRTTTTLLKTSMPSPFSWQPIVELKDPSNLTYTGKDWLGMGESSAMSLFGYDVEFSTTGEWLAIGIPGRSFTKFQDLPIKHVSWHPYHGSVILYRKNVVSSYSFFAELSIKDAGKNYAFADRFGSKIQFSNDPSQPYIFISCNGGWDGVSAPGMAAPDQKEILLSQDTINKTWPAQPTQRTSNLGVYVFKFNSVSGKWIYVDFIASQSRVPFGMLGIDFTVGGNNNSDLQLAMRDYRPTANRTSGGVVALYALNETNNKFFQTNLFSAADAGTTSDWKNEDFFGVGLSLVTEVLPILHIGAPGSSVLHRFIKSKTRWELDALTSNPGFVERSFFSGFLANSQDSRFVLVSNAVTSQGPGIVYLHHRKLPGYHLLDFSEEFSAVSTGYLAYDWIATLKKSNSTDTKYLQDQFGKVASAAGPWIVVGAPVEGCVYTFAAPVAAPLTPGVTPTDIINNLTTEPTTNYGLYIGIGVALAFLVILPILVLLIIRRHKKKMLTQFALNDAKNIGNPPEPEAS